MSRADGMTDVEMLVELQAIYRLKAVRDHAVDRKDWATYAELHADDYVACRFAANRLSAEKLQLRHFQFRWRTSPPCTSRMAGGASVIEPQRTHAETSPGATFIAADFSGENPWVGVG